jgi:hypothetical protein
MTQREEIERRIREALASETSALALSEKLFRPDGLFAQLAPTEEDRRALAQTGLFQEAQHRLSDLQRQEGAAFGRAVAQVQPPLSGNSLILQLLDVKAG